MSGTSLDGIDIAYCEFTENRGKWKYNIKEAITYDYPIDWKTRLNEAYSSSARFLAETDKDLGLLMSEILRLFISNFKLKPDFIASHGHTIFHQPASRYTLQIGSGHHIASRLGIPVINNFRNQDVAKGGEGAPLVPIGDKLLFGEYDFCLNLGGIANISFDDPSGIRKAYDISPCNMALNQIANKSGRNYDDEGKLAREGKINIGLLDRLNSLDFYWNSSQNSLGREWYEENFSPILNSEMNADADILATLVEHIAQQVARTTAKHPKKNMMITGGGAYNDYLIERLKWSVAEEVIIPGKKIIDFKEAMVFAFLGVLRLRGDFNTLASVTGAKSDTCSGCIILP